MCGLCDNFGVIDDPLNARRVKACPECDTPPIFPFAKNENGSIRSMSMSEILYGPDGPDEDDDMSEIQQRRLDARRAEEAEFLANYLASLAPHDSPCKCL